ncbi:MAG: hypothetical protein U0572_06205 [Phycisphaerales bacterium]
MSVQRRSIVLVMSSVLAVMLAGVSSAQNALDPRPRTPAARNGQFGQGAQGGNRAQQSGARGPVQRGGGNALDRNLQVGSGGINVANPNIDFNSRNLIVTDSVAGGRGFRGTVGYRAAGDFSGQTAGDSTQSFRSGSALSGPSFLTSTAFNDRFSIAQGMGVFEYRRDATPAMRNPVADAAEGRIRLDRAGSNLMYFRAMQSAVEPSSFAQGVDRSQRPVEYTISNVQGLRMRRLDDTIERTGLPVYEQARARHDVIEGTLSPEAARLKFKSAIIDAEDSRLDTQFSAEPQTTKVAPNGSAYDEIVAKIVKLYADRPDVKIDADPRAIEKARKDLAEVREALGGPRETETKPGEKPAAKPGETSGTTPGSTLGTPPTTDEHGTDATNPNGDGSASRRPSSESSSSPTQPETPEAKLKREEAQRRETIMEAARRLSHRTTVTDLAPGDRARVDELVRDGQRQLSEGEFFKAERSFDQALLINPENPMLTAGLTHAQLGAGLYLSSALSLRTLFTRHPEVIDVRYDRKLLPNETRLRLAVETLRTRIGSKDADSYGLTLAYIGHQLGDRAVTEEGLKSLTGSLENDLLRDLLTRLWLSTSDASSPPSAPEKSDSTPQSEPQPK